MDRANTVAPDRRCPSEVSRGHHLHRYHGRQHRFHVEARSLAFRNIFGSGLKHSKEGLNVRYLVVIIFTVTMVASTVSMWRLGP